MNIQNSVDLTNTGHRKPACEKNTLFYIGTGRNMKRLGKNLANMCTISARKTTELTKEIRDLSKRRAIPCSLKGASVSLVLPNLVYKFNAIPIKISASCCVGTDNSGSEVHMERQLNKRRTSIPPHYGSHFRCSGGSVLGCTDLEHLRRGRTFGQTAMV